MPADAGQRQTRNQDAMPESNAEQVFAEVQSAYQADIDKSMGTSTDPAGTGDAA